MTNRPKKESLVLMLVLMSVIVITLSNVEPLVFAAPTATLSTTSGPVGTTVTVTGTGWNVADTGLTFPSTPSVSGGFAVNITCTITPPTGIINPGCQFSVSLLASPAIYTITVTGTVGGDTTTATFTVTSSTVSVSPNQVGPAFFVTVTGSGFSPLDQGCSISVNTPTPILGPNLLNYGSGERRDSGVVHRTLDVLPLLILGHTL